VGTVKVTTKTAALAISDMAGKGPNRTRNKNPLMARPNFVDVLNSKLGRPASRFIWFAGERHIDRVNREMQEIINEFMNATGARIVRRG
jgi:hypothetical protein